MRTSPRTAPGIGHLLSGAALAVAMATTGLSALAAPSGTAQAHPAAAAGCAAVIGTWFGTSGVGGLTEILTIDARYQVSGQYREKQANALVGLYSGMGTCRQGALSFHQHMYNLKPPIASWTDSDISDVRANGSVLTLHWQNPGGGSGTVQLRSVQAQPVAGCAAVIGTWFGTSGVGGLTEILTIDARYQVSGQYREKQTNALVGLYSGVGTCRQGALSFHQHMYNLKPPIASWTDSDISDVRANGSVLTLHWQNPGGGRGMVQLRRAGR